MMKANDVRKEFLDFFASKKHTIVESDTVVPKDDPTVLFTTAGMQQFKRQFLGYLEGYSRAASSQKCIRTDDLDLVGKTAFHHTFFEMLGNFSFGDYFKKEAIIWAWEFLTEVLSIPAEKLWVSVYREDTEAEKIWLKGIKIPKARLVKLGDKSNFWPANAKENGPNGPCGPCSEIFYDYGVNPNCTNKNCDPDCDCGRFSEIWNLVFTQFNRKENGTLDPLPAKNIDTGMGLERLVAVVQGKKSNYETDLFVPILTAIDAELKKQKLSIEDQKRLLVADHIRAIVFAITDGVIPSNKERGSVVKRLISDSADIILSAGAKQATIHKFVAVVVETMKGPYPELNENVKNVANLIKKTEEAYIKVRKERIPQLKKEFAKCRTAKELGDFIFKYRDTFGLTLPTIYTAYQEVAADKEKWKKGINYYENLMEQQQERSRASSKIASNVFTDADLNLDVPKTEFFYDLTQGKGTILKLFHNDKEVDQVEAGNTVKIILDKTPFYAESGGQIGDTGTVTGKRGSVRILDTQKKDGIIIHHGEVDDGVLVLKDKVETAVDEDRRRSIMRNHTATHILQAALREILGAHVQQQGSLVAEDRLRFDFTHPQAISDKEIEQIETYVNSRILQCDEVSKETMSIEKARKSGALAFFAEKYGKTVRVVSINGYSKEFCGGTHLDSTGQIGIFKIVHESAIAQGIRRLEAKTGNGAWQFIKDQEHQLSRIAKIIKAPKGDLVERIELQTKKLKQLEKNLGQHQFAAIKESIGEIIKGATLCNGTKIITHSFNDVDMGTLRKVIDLVKQKAKSSVSILGTSSSGNAYILAAVSEDMVKKGINANELIQKIAPVIKGSGGGRAEFAQAGSKETTGIKDAIKKAETIIKDKLKTE